MGEETDGAVESVSKLQEKIEALTGVDIIDANGAYKDTYTILKEIGEVWKDLDPMDQAAALELMAGKNRANTLAAILNNMEDLGAAYESALKAEGSALKENEAYLDSIQGRIDLFNNSVQTMWMNTLDSDAVKLFVNLGTGLIETIDKLGLVQTLIAGIVTYVTTFSKNKLDLASILGIHNLDDSFLKGFSAFGKQGFTGWVANKFKGKGGQNDIASAILGNPRDIAVSVQDFADAIQGNIDDYVTIDTSKIDTEIDSVQNKLITARKQLDDAKSRDWNYYKTLGSRSPAQDRDNTIKEKINEIDQLENKLKGLQKTRDDIVKSAATNVATSMKNSVESEVQAHKSLLSVLSEVKNTKLYLGDEQDAATKIDNISAAAKKGQSELINYTSSLSDTDIALKAYVASVKDGNYSLAGFQQFIAKHNSSIKASGVAAKAAAAGHALLNTALSMGISMLASFAINTVVKWVDKAVTTTKEAAEAAEETTNKYKEMQSTLQEQKKTIDDLSASYERLSKGVDLNTNENISLTTSSYEEYLDICNDIADMYPHLVTGFDAQGNAILSLKGNVDELTQAYRDAAQAARQEMIAGGTEIFKTFKTTYDNNPDTTFETIGLTQQLTVAKKLQELISSATDDEIKGFFSEISSGKGIEIDGSTYNNNDLIKTLKSMGVAVNALNNPEFKSGWDGSIDIEKFKQTSTKVNSFIKKNVAQINTETSKVKSLLDAYLGEDLNYSSYSDKTRSYIDQIVSGLDAEFIREFDTADALYNHIKTNIVDVFEDPSITAAVSELSALQLDFNKGDISYSDYQKRLTEHLNKIQNKFDSGTLSQLKVGIGIDEESLKTAENHIATMVDGFNDEGKIIDNVQGKINALSVEDLQIAGQLEVPEGTIYTWDQLIEKIRQAKIAASEDFDLTDYKDSITSLTSSISTYQEAIQKLDKGSFTLSDFMELIEDMPDLAKGVDISSKSFNGLRSNLQKAIKTSTKSFIRDLKELKYRLLETGKSTEAIDQLIDAVEDIPEDALDSTIDKYSTLADEIDRARVAQNRLSESMGENPNEGYETRGEAMDYMKEAMKKGEIGSESNLWNVAKQYGFTYDSAKTINENADALAKFIAVREKWFATEDDGDDRTDDGYSFKGIESYIETVESAVKKNAELQKYLTWDYDEDTGKFNFDYDNENLEEIVSLLGQTESLVGLTEEEFMDLMVQIGQYFGIKWGDNDDVLQHLDGIATSAKDAKTKVEEYGEAMQKYFGEDTTIDLTKRPMVSKEEMQGAGWTEFDSDYGTTYSSTYTSEDGKKAIVVTPILPDGSVLSPQELDEYAKKLLAGEEIDPDVDIKLKEFNGANSQAQADQYAQSLSKVQAQYDQLRDTLGINTTLDSSGIEGLKNIEAIQKTITTNSKGLTIIDQEAFTKVLTDAGYAEDQIELIIDKIKELNSESITSDSFKIDEALTANGIAGLKEIESLQSAIKESSSGWTVVDTDVFSSVLQEAGYTKTQIDDLIKKIQEYESVVLTSGNTDPLGLNATNMSIDTLKSSLSTLGVDFDESIGKWFDGEKELKINVPDLIATLTEKGWSEEAIRNYCTQLSQTNIEGFTVKVSQEEIDAAIAKANEVPAEKPINVEITGTAYTDAQNINSELDKMKDKTIDVTINETTVKKTKEADANGTVWWNPTTWFADGTAHVSGSAFAGGNWGAPRTETALTGELGPELLVRGNRWTTVGENGAEFTQVKRGDIIFNHKQTESLLKNGYVTSRGKAYAGGTAYAKGDSTFAKYSFSGDGGYTKYDVNDKAVDKFGNAVDKFSDAADSTSDASDEFRETFDWIEVRIEEINDALSLKSAQLENAVGPEAQNAIIDDMIDINQSLYDNLLAGANEYYAKAKSILSDIPPQFREAAKDGSIAITEFAGKTSEEAYNAIQEYREWVQKGDDLTEQAEATLTEIANLAKQGFDNIANKYDNKNDITEAKNEKLEAAISLQEEKGNPVSDKFYEQIKTNTETLLKNKREEREKLQADLDLKVENGDIPKYSDDWYDMVGQIYEADTAIIEYEKDIESCDNSINDIYWDNFEEGIARTEYLEDETQNLIDLMANINEPVDDDGNWTKEGIASLGLYAQQMEIAEFKSKQYAEAIDELNSGYKKGEYSESEYLEKLNELKKGQQDSIKSYYDAQDAIKDLQKTRVEAIKKGIDKEIEAYDKLIQKKKEELNVEKDMYDFQKSAQQSAKNVADIQRKLAALSADNSAAGIAQRKQLEAELAEAKAEEEDLYYSRSIENQQNALDKENEAFKEEKEKEKETLDESLENIDEILAATLLLVQDNAKQIGETLGTTADEYGLTLSDAILSPWNSTLPAIDAYDTKFGDSASATTTKLGEMKTAWQELIAEMNTAAGIEIKRQKEENKKTTQAKKKKKQDPNPPQNPPKTDPEPEPSKTPGVGSTVTVDKTATHFSSKSKNAKMASFVPGGSYTVYQISGDEVLIGRKGVYTGWVKKSDLVGYAKGTKGVKEDQLALIDELGEELVMHADGTGKLAFLTKGSAVIPHDITENLMKLGSLDPQIMLDQNRPQIAPNQNIVNTEINIDCSVGTLMNIEHCDQGTLPDVEKMVNKAFEKQVQKMNNSLKRFVR